MSVRSVTTLNTQVMSELAASLERTIGITTIPCVLPIMLVRGMATFDAEIMSKLATGFERTVCVSLEGC